MPANTGKPSAPRIRRHRVTLRERGLRAIQIWVPDTRAPNFAEEAHRQSLAINEADERDGIMDWIEAVSLFDEGEES